MTTEQPPNRPEPLSVKNVHISRMEGIREGFRIDSVSSGINLIHGPNGIGKSRTALALQSLIWPRLGTHGTSLIGNIAISGDSWNIELDLGKATWHKNNTQVAGFIHTIPPDSHRNRYLLTLQDLLQLDNRDFAHEIHKEASGGYDLPLIRSTMNIATHNRRFKPAKSVNHLRDIQETLYGLRRREEELLGEEQALDRLRIEHAEAITASNRLNELREARAYQDDRHQLEAATLAFDSFPRSLDKLMGDELQRAKSLMQNLETLREEHRKESIRASALQEGIQSTGFADQIPSDSVVSSLRQRLVEAQQSEVEIRQADSLIAELEDKLGILRNRLTRDLTEEQMMHLDESGLRDLAEIGREWQRAQLSADSQAEVERWLQKSNDWNRESLRRGVDLLSRHLRIQNAEANRGRKHLITVVLVSTAILIILEAVLLFTSWSQYALLFALTALAPLWLAFTLKSDNAKAEREQIQSQYSTLGLAEPANWSSDAVHQTLNTVHESVAQAEIDHERELRWANLHENRTRAELHLQTVINKRTSFTQTYGLGLSESIPESLGLLAKALEDWRRETEQLSKALVRKRALESTRDTMLSECESHLHSHGSTAVVRDAIDAHAGIEDLNERIVRAHQTSADLQHTHRRLEKELSPRISEAERQLAWIYEALDLELHDLRGIMELTEQMEAYREAREALKNADVATSISRARLPEGSSDESLDYDAIALAMARETERAERRDKLQAEISRINTEIDRARLQTSIEAQVAKEQAALESLAEGRNQDYTSAANRSVFEFLQNRNREVNRPPVFRAANDLFISFTNGEYRLGLDEESSEFTALEADTGRSVPLDRLSSGTRVQLLLAVRLAFIEASEQGVQLPLILDEILGNTDDTRARAIIDATIDIAARGRQVFYFTAQHDEIGKWSSALNEIDHSLEWTVHNLASIRGEPNPDVATDYIWDTSMFEKLKVSDDEDRTSLFELLGRPSVDFLTASILEIDLWYIIPEASDLVELRNRGIHRWGQYLNLHSGDHLRGAWSHSLHERATVRARVIEEFLRAWRVGRPGPFTIDDLKESKLITDSFWERIVGCAQRHNWSAAALIRALDQGEVSRFRRETTEQLSDWFRDNGFLTDVYPIDDAMIRARVISSLDDAIQSGIIQVDEVDELLSEFCSPNAPRETTFRSLHLQMEA